MAAPVDDAFAKVLRGHIDFLQYRPCFDAYLADGRVLLEARAFIQETIQVKQPFREGRWVMRIRVHYLVVVLRDGGASRDRADQEAEEHRQRQCDVLAPPGGAADDVSSWVDHR